MALRRRLPSLLRKTTEGRAAVYVLPVVLLLCVTLPHLDQGDFRKDSARYAAVSLQVWRTGDFLDLSLGPGIPYHRKPPLAFWIHGLFLHLLGVSLAASRIPGILVATGTVLATTFVAGRLGGRSTAMAAGCILALTIHFFRRVREISLDLWLAFFLVVALALLVEAARRRRLGFVLAGGAAVGLSLLVKPLVGLQIFPLLLATLFATGRRRDVPWIFLALGASVLVAAPWHVAMTVRHGEAFTGTFFGHEILDRALGDPDLIGDGRPLLYYVELLAKGYWPWLLLVLAGIFAWVRGRVGARRRQGLTLAGIWCAGWLVFLTVFPDKSPTYALPIYPMLAVIAAEGLCRLPLLAVRRWCQRWSPFAVAAAVLLAIVVAVLPLELQRPPSPGWPALFEWIESESIPVDRLWAVSLGENDAGRFYLATGRWPRRVGEKWGRTLDELPPGSLVFRGRLPHEGLAPGTEILFQAESMAVTRE